MNKAEQLKKELANSGLFDKDKVLEVVSNGIKHNGESCITEYARMSGVKYGNCNIECSNAIGHAIASYLRSEGFNVKNDHHPISGHWCGYIVTI
jgi:hypothetical protein